MRFSWHPNLAFKIIAWAFVPAVIILGAVGVVMYAAYQDVTETLVMERNQEVAHLKALQLANKLGEYGEIVSTEARSADLYSGDLDRQQAALQRATSHWAIFDQGMVLLDTFGMVLAAEPQRSDIVMQNWSDRSYYRQALQAQAMGSTDAVFSDVVSDGPRGARVIAIAAPVIGPQGEFAGTLVGLLSARRDAPNALYAAIVRLRLVDVGGGAYVTDGKGQVIYHSDAAQIGVDLSSFAPVQRALDGETGSLRSDGHRPSRIVASYAPVPSTSWALVMEENWLTALNRGRAYGPYFLALLLLGVAVPSLVVALSIRRITGPIKALTEAANQVANGQFQQTIQTETGDEIEELADSFNGMAQQLQALHDHQEERIAQRTRELACLNAIAATVSRSTDLDEVLARALEETLDVVGVDSGGIHLLEKSENVLVLAAHRGFSTDIAAALDRLPADSGLAGHIVRTGEPLTVPNLAVDPRLIRTTIREAGYQSLAAAPLKAKGQVLGALFTLTLEHQQYDQEDSELMASIGNQIGVAVENARSNEQAQQLAVMEERQRLARELHDAVTQTLFSASLLSEALPSVWQESPSQGQDILEELRRLNKGALAEMRALLLELRPSVLAEANLADLLRQLGLAVTGRSGASVQVQIGECMPMPPDVHVAFYRVAQEALNNVVKHSHATEVMLRLECRDLDGDDPQLSEAVLCVSDNGRGFDDQNVPKERLGLGIMRERAKGIHASLDINSDPSRGTTITLTWNDEPQTDPSP